MNEPAAPPPQASNTMAEAPPPLPRIPLVVGLVVGEGVAWDERVIAELQALAKALPNTPLDLLCLAPSPSVTLPLGGAVRTAEVAGLERKPFDSARVEIAQESTPEQTAASQLVYVVRHCDVLIALGDPERHCNVKEGLELQIAARPPAVLGSLRNDPLGSFAERGPAVLLRPGGKRSLLVPARVPVDPKSGAILPSKAIWRDLGPQAVVPPFTWLRQLGRAARTTWESLKPAELIGRSADHDDQKSARKENRLLADRLEALDAMNRHAAHHPPDAGKVETELAAAHRFFAEQPGLLTVLSALVRVRRASSDLSIMLEDRLKWLLRAVFLLLFSCLVTFHVYAHLPSATARHAVDPQTKQEIHFETYEYRAWAIWAAMVALLAALVGVGIAGLSRWDQRRIDARTLAEALRVRYWWSVAGVGRSVALHHPRQLRTEVAWIRQAVRSLCAPVPEDWAGDFDGRKDARIERLESALHGFVEEQRRYHFKKKNECGPKAARLRVVGMLVAAAGWASMLCLLPWHPTHPSHALIFAAGVLTILGGLLIGYTERRTHEELANLHDRTYGMFRTAARDIAELLQAARDAAAASPPEQERHEWCLRRAQNIVGALGLEHLRENGQWLLTRRAKPLEIHVA